MDVIILKLFFLLFFLWGQPKFLHIEPLIMELPQCRKVEKNSHQNFEVMWGNCSFWPPSSQKKKNTNKQIHSIQQNKQELIFTFEKVEPETSCLIIIHPIKIANIVDSWLIYEPTTGFNTNQRICLNLTLCVSDISLIWFINVCLLVYTTQNQWTRLLHWCLCMDMQ